MVYSKGWDIILYSKTEKSNCKICILSERYQSYINILTKYLMTYLKKTQIDPGDIGIWLSLKN